MYDAIIVGARCAGSPTAMLLARRGYRTSQHFPAGHALNSTWPARLFRSGELSEPTPKPLDALFSSRGA